MGEFVFGRVHTDHRESEILVLTLPVFDIRKSPKATDAGIIPKIDEENIYSLSIPDGNRFRIEPEITVDLRSLYVFGLEFHRK